MKYTFPVCGYNELLHPPDDYMICPCCGTEFGYTDFNATHEELRERWIKSGMSWHSESFPEPPNWDPYGQLLAAGYGDSLTKLESSEREVAPH